MINDYITIKNDDEKRELIWKLMVGGSSVKDVKTQKYQSFDANATSTLTKKLLAGKILEQGIIDLYNHNKNDDEKIKVVKDIFVSVNKPFLSANIDGFVGENLKNAKYIIEVKNTNTKEISKLVARYKNQANYYCWFFNVEKCKFLFLIDGWDLKEVWFEYEPKLFEKDTKNYLQYLKTKWEFHDLYQIFNEHKDYDSLLKFLKNDVDLSNFENNNLIENKLLDYIKIKEQLNELTKLEKSSKDSLNEILPNEFDQFYFYDYLIERKKRESISYKESFYKICENFNIAVNQNEFIQKSISESLSIVKKTKKDK